MSKVFKGVIKGIAVAVAAFFILPYLSLATPFIGLFGIVNPLTAALVGGALTGGLAALLAPSVRFETTLARARVSVDANAEGKWIFGRTALATDSIWAGRHGSAENFFSYVIAGAAHEIGGYDTLYINDEAISFSGAAATGSFGGALWRQTNLGTAAQTAFADIDADDDFAVLWKTTSNGLGMAHYRLRFDLSVAKFTGGIPTRITQAARGCLVYDPRLDTTRGGSGSHRADDRTTWEFTNGGIDIGENWALIVLWYLLGWYIDGKLVIGMGIDPNDIDMDQVIAAANVCEATVDGAPRYYIGGILAVTNNHEDIIGQLEGAINGKIAIVGGMYFIWAPNDDLTPFSTIDETDLLRAAGVEYIPSTPLDRLYNTGRGRFVDDSVDGLYLARPYAEVIEATAVTDDGGTRLLSHDVAFIQDDSRAQRVVRGLIRRSRFGATWRFAMGPKGLTFRPFTVTTLNCKETDFTDVTVRVLDMTFSPSGVVAMEVIEEDSSIYDTTIALGISVVSNDPGGIDPSSTVSVTGLAAASSSVQGDIDTVQMSFNVTWNDPGSYVLDTQLQYKVASTSTWVDVAPAKAGFTTAIISPLAPLTLYDVRARHITLVGLPSAWVAIQQTSGALGAEALVPPFGAGKIGGTDNFVYTINADVGGTPDDGEIRVQGTTFNHPDGTVVLTDVSDFAVYTVYEGTTIGRFFIMFSAAVAETRFGGTAIQWGAGDDTRFICVTYNPVDGWRARNDAGTYFAFTPLATDCIIALFYKFAASGGIETVMPLTAGRAGIDGNNPITSHLTNEAHVVSADKNGLGYSLVEAGGMHKVYDNVTIVDGAHSIEGTVSISNVIEIGFVESDIGPGTFSGPVRNYRNSIQVLTAVSADTPRYECGIDGIVQGILIEPAVTDYLPRNNDLVHAAWTPTRATVTQPSTIPDIEGGTDGFLFDDDLATGTHYNSADLVGVPDNSPVCCIAVVKPAAGIPFANLMFRSKNNDFPVARFDFDNGTIGTNAKPAAATIYTHGMRYWGGGYYLCWFSVDSDAGATVPKFYVGSADATQAPSYLGSDDTMHIAFCAAQDGYYPKLPFATTTGNESLAGDTLTYASSNQPANNFTLDIIFIGSDAVHIAGTPDTRYLYESGDFSIRVTDDNIIANINGNTLTYTGVIRKDQRYKIRVRKLSSGAYLYVNGVLAGSNTAAGYQAAITPGTIYIGSDNTGANQLGFVIERFGIEDSDLGPQDTLSLKTRSGKDPGRNNWAMGGTGSNDDAAFIRDTITLDDMTCLIIRFYWNELESTSGTYDLSSIYGLLDACAEKNTFLKILPMWRRFNTTDDVMPADLVAANQYSSSGGYNSPMYETDVRTRYQDFCTDQLIDTFKDHPWFAGIQTNETAGQNDSPSDTYTKTKLETELRALYIALATHCPYVYTDFYWNYITDSDNVTTAGVSWDNIFNGLEDNINIRLPSPDVLASPASSYTGINNRVYPFFTPDYEGSVGYFGGTPDGTGQTHILQSFVLGSSMQYDSYRWDESGRTLLELFNFATEHLDCQFVIWTWTSITQSSVTLEYEDNGEVLDNTAVLIAAANPAFAGTTSLPNSKNGLTMVIDPVTGVYSLSGTAWSSRLETFSLRAVYGGKTIDKEYSIAKAIEGIEGDDGAAGADGADGADGGDGSSIHISRVYTRSASAPSTPAVDAGSYNFTTNALTMDAPWTENIPVGADPLYTSVATWSIVGTTGTDTTTVWSTPIKIDNGAATLSSLSLIGLVDINVGGGAAAVGFKVDSDGDIYIYEEEGSPYVVDQAWIGIGNNTHFEVKLAKTTGNNPTGAAQDTYLATTADREWEWIINSGSKDYDGYLTFRRISDNLELGSVRVQVSISDT